jgi:RNA polymerase sigma factor (sigma-70 family)
MLKILRIRRTRVGDLVPRDPTAPDDLELLVRRCGAGDASAMRTLLESLGPAMLQVIRRVLGVRHPEVEDTLQEATIAFVGALPSFRGECSLRHFACRVAAFRAITARRRCHLGDEVGTDDLDGLALHRPAQEQADAALAARRRALVRRLLVELPEPQAEALVLHCVVGLTVEELARASGVPVETARSRLRLAKGALRGRIVDDAAALELVEDLS